jgi:hypothetical protein
MIIVDYSQTIISNLMAEFNGRKDVDVEINLLRHMVVNTIRSYHVNFKDQYGELVIACDHKRYWRKDIFPYYKANRKKAREDSGYNWNAIFDAINTIKAELKEFFPYRVVEVNGAEADDIIATLCKHVDQPIMIVSGDHDFIQLQKNSSVKQWSPITKKNIVCDSTPEQFLFEHIIKGDKGDGVPNVLTSDDAIITNVRQKPIQSKKMEMWYKDRSTLPTDVVFTKNFDRNQKLIDLSMIPKDIEQSIINTFNIHPLKDRSLILNYFIEHKMKNLMESLEDF